MNRILFSKGHVVPATLLRGCGSVKSFAPSIRNLVTNPSTKFVCKPIVYRLTSDCFKQFQRKNASYAPINIDAKTLTKDVIVFKYNNPRYFKIMNIFGIAQFFFWVICSEFTLSNLRNTPVNEGAPNFKDFPLYLQVNLGENKYKYGIATISFLLGLTILGFVWTFTLRSVRYLVLRKGGDSVSFVTYGPFGTNRIMNVPLRCVSAVQSREANVSALPIKVKGRNWHYLLDNRGEYTNPELFDHIINVKRRF